MERVLDTNEYLDTVCRILAEGAKSVPVPVTGVSMGPFLHQGDFVYLELPEEPIRKGDILLFRRPNGHYVLHRVIGITPEGYRMLGDGQLVVEPIEKSWVRARAVSAKIRGEIVTAGSFRWWLFAYPWRWLALWRGQIFRLWRLIKKAMPGK